LRGGDAGSLPEVLDGNSRRRDVRGFVGVFSYDPPKH